MTVKINSLAFEDSEYQRDSEVWKASTLYLFAKAKEYPVFDLPLVAVDLSDKVFEVPNLRSFIYQCKRVYNCTFDYPVLLDDYGQIADGYHRVCKAILEGKKAIKAIRLEEMPAYDFIRKK